MSKVRVGIIGIGGMGGHHFNLLRNEVKGAELAAVCDTDPARLAWAKERGFPAEACHATAEALFAAGGLDGVLIATPHYEHPPLAIEAFRRGLHVLTEKPAGVYTKQVREMNEAARASGRIFGIMFQQRTIKTHQKMKELVASGELGELRRVSWVVTEWFRTQHYYNSGGWRATWAGEGGGVLINQCPHNLDLLQWICGLPTRVRAFCHFGRYHDIEVEDDVTAYGEYANGASMVFVTSTGEAPGANRFEIVGDRGQLVLENGELTFRRNRVPMDEFLRTSNHGFASPECWTIKLPGGGGDQHKGILQNWVDAIAEGKPLFVPGEEGIRGLELSNAMLLSAWTDGWVDIPVDQDRFLAKLQEKIRTSRFVKKTVAGGAGDINASFKK